MDTYTDPFQATFKHLAVLTEKVDHLTALVERVTSSAAPDLSKPLGVTEAANFLGVTTATLYGLNWEKKVRSHKVGKKLYFFPADLLEYVKSGRQTTAEDLEGQARNVITKRRTRGSGSSQKLAAVPV